MDLFIITLDFLSTKRKQEIYVSGLISEKIELGVMYINSMDQSLRLKGRPRCGSANSGLVRIGDVWVW